MTTDLWRLSATELAAGFLQGDFTPCDALASVRARQATVNPVLNAVIHDMPDAQEAAERSAERYARGQALGRLDGVPISLKDNLVVADTPSSWGTRALADWRPDADELPVARLRAAGAVLFARTNVPEFTLSGYTDNPIYGVTGNPWAPTLTPGGSSGGAVAAVAAGIGPLALGTDGGGSIRRPAAHCGLVGFKPSIGKVPRAGGFPSLLLDYEVVGPMARCVEDAQSMLEVLDDTAANDATVGASRADSVQQHRVLYVESFADAPVDPEIRDNVRRAVAVFADLGCEIETCAMPLDIEPINAIWPEIGEIGLARLEQRHPDWLVSATLEAREKALSGARCPATRLWEVFERTATLRDVARQLFDNQTLMITPSIAALSWPAGEAYPPTIDGQSVGPRGQAVFSGWVNAAGLPAINLPAQPSRAGLPIGFQIVGGPGRDDDLLAIAAAYQRIAPWQASYGALWKRLGR